LKNNQRIAEHEEFFVRQLPSVLRKDDYYATTPFIVCQIVWLVRSHWLFPVDGRGLKNWKTASGREEGTRFSQDMKRAPLPLCTQPQENNTCRKATTGIALFSMISYFYMKKTIGEPK